MRQRPDSQPCPTAEAVANSRAIGRSTGLWTEAGGDGEPAVGGTDAEPQLVTLQTEAAKSEETGRRAQIGLRDPAPGPGGSKALYPSIHASAPEEVPTGMGVQPGGRTSGATESRLRWLST